MKKLILFVIASVSLGLIATAQTPPPPVVKPAAPDVTPPAPVIKRDNIIIRKNGDSKEKVTIVIDGDKITVNGKPADEFKSDNVEIVTDDVIEDAPLPPLPPAFSRGGIKSFSRNYNNDFNFSFSSNKALLGVMVNNAANNGGAKITNVTKQGAAEKAGLKQGDVITKIGDKSVNDAGDVTEIINKYKPAEKVTITYLRDGKQATATATLDKNKRTNNFWDNKGEGFSITSDGAPFIQWTGKPHLGIQVQDTDDNNGVKVTNVNDDEAPAAKAGLQEDDIITTVNGKNITSVDDLKNAVSDAKEGDTLKLQYKRNNQLQSADVKFPKRLKKSDL